MSDGFTDQTWAASVADALGARDPIGLTSQVRFLRDGFERAGHGRPALILLVVRNGEENAAMARIEAVLNGAESGASDAAG